MDTTTLLIIIVVVLVAAYFISRSRNQYGGTPTYRRGPGTGPVERPTYDDPDYSSSGSIGGVETAPPPVQRTAGDTAPSGRKYDDPNYRSGGSIGGS
ncbi:hypothetical protein SE17_34775 [Kouleothrix aurantiaca]|jgi:hypothetical protein|uniref:Uncharacterized protein n=1 Tax=Kouleothrix aurantiaca TaxID=186479 RepID=A0A0P9CSQ5_9CHLR|nr:hypothetical protein SE17_34775 [Kouleothrix aurantiaca]